MNAFANIYTFIAPHLKSIPLTFTPAGSIGAMLAVVYASKSVHAILSFALLQKYDNVQASFRYNTGKDSWQAKTVQRAYSAHSNHWEAFAGFSVAMLLALQRAPAGSEEELKLLGNAFLVSRVVYNAAYVLAFNEPLSFVRSSMFMVGIALVVRIFAIALA